MVFSPLFSQAKQLHSSSILQTPSSTTTIPTEHTPQSLSQGVSQQMPSTQNPLWHSLGARHTWPWAWGWKISTLGLAPAPCAFVAPPTTRTAPLGSTVAV